MLCKYILSFRIATGKESDCGNLIKSQQAQRAVGALGGTGQVLGWGERGAVKPLGIQPLCETSSCLQLVFCSEKDPGHPHSAGLQAQRVCRGPSLTACGLFSYPSASYSKVHLCPSNLRCHLYHMQIPVCPWVYVKSFLFHGLFIYSCGSTTLF